MEALERKFIYFWECDIFGLPGRYAGRYQKLCVSKRRYGMAHANLELFSLCPSWTLVSSVSSLSARLAGGLYCTTARPVL